MTERERILRIARRAALRELALRHPAEFRGLMSDRLARLVLAARAQARQVRRTRHTRDDPGMIEETERPERRRRKR